jgi:hypothetical protein
MNPLVSIQKAPKVQKGSAVTLVKEPPNDKARMKVKSDELYGQQDKSGDDLSEDEMRKVKKQQVFFTFASAELNRTDYKSAGKTTEKISV